MNDELPIIDRARLLLSYDRETGNFTWNSNRGGTARKGSIAGAVIQDRRYIKVDYKLYLAHRLAYAFITGEFPPHEIDHIDGNSLNNAWVNLRACTKYQNMQNRKVSKSNQSGLLGVSKKKNRWQAVIRVNGKQFYLGLFKSKEDAHAAYVEAKRKLHTFNPEVRKNG